MALKVEMNLPLWPTRKAMIFSRSLPSSQILGEQVKLLTSCLPQQLVHLCFPPKLLYHCSALNSTSCPCPIVKHLLVVTHLEREKRTTSTLQVASSPPSWLFITVIVFPSHSRQPKAGHSSLVKSVLSSFVTSWWTLVMTKVPSRFLNASKSAWWWRSGLITSGVEFVREHPGLGKLEQGERPHSRKISNGRCNPSHVYARRPLIRKWLKIVCHWLKLDMFNLSLFRPKFSPGRIVLVSSWNKLTKLGSCDSWKHYWLTHSLTITLGKSLGRQGYTTQYMPPLCSVGYNATLNQSTTQG